MLLKLVMIWEDKKILLTERITFGFNMVEIDNPSQLHLVDTNIFIFLKYHTLLI